MISQHNYTVVELVAVIVIVGLISTVAVTKFRKMPVFITVESKVNQLKKIMAQARNKSVCQGVNTEIVFDAGKRRFYLPQEAAENKKISPVEIFLPPEIKLAVNGKELEDESAKVILFKFYPDGSGGGNSISLKLENHKIKISISPLSGSIMTEELNKNK